MRKMNWTGKVGIALCLAIGLAAAPAWAQVIINELDCDTPTTPINDSEEFIELYDGGVGNTVLDGLVLVLYNGNGDVSYGAFDLDGFSTDANGYFLLGTTGVTPTPSITWPNVFLQNGVDAAALYTGDDTDFPNGTPVTTTNLIDAIVYDTNDPDDDGLLPLLNPGQPQVNEAFNAMAANDSNQRCPNGVGGGRNTSNYIQASPTPGAANNCPMDPNGACCLETGECLVVTQANCENVQEGIYQGDDTDCDPNPCPQPIGACCEGATCMIRTLLECQTVGGIFKGDMTTCVAGRCEGACCTGMPQDMCMVMTPADCEAAMGIYKGDTTTCATNLCVGGCCDMNSATCTVRTPADCVNQLGGGIYRGDGSTCTPNPCPVDFTGLLINEIRHSQSGGDVDEYFELVNVSASPISLDGVSYIVIGDDGNDNPNPEDSGIIQGIVDLSGFTIDPGDHFFAAQPFREASFFTVPPDLEINVPFEEFNDNTTHLLVFGLFGVIGDDVDEMPDDDCIIDNPRWLGILDQVALIKSDNVMGEPSNTECHYGTGDPFIDTFKDGAFSPAHVFRFPDSSNTGFEDWQVSFDGFDLAFGNDTPGLANALATGACCSGAACLDDETRQVCEQALSGVWLGRDTTCAMDGSRCEGACCICQDPGNDCTMFTCTITDEDSCINMAGVFQGPETLCPPTDGFVDCAQCLTLDQVRMQAVGAGVRICDVTVSSLFDPIESGGFKSFRIQDSSGTDGQTALTVFGTTGLIDDEFGGVQEGDVIDLQGTIDEFNALLELANDEPRALRLSKVDSTGGMPPAPIAVTTTDFQDGNGEGFEAEIVMLECVVFLDTGTFAAATNYTVSDGTDTAMVRVNTTAQIDIIGQTIPGGPVSLTGIFDQFDTSDPRDGGYQLALRTISDIDMSPAGCGDTAACCLGGAACRDDLPENLCNALGGDFRMGQATCPPTPPCLDNTDTRITEIRTDQPGAGGDVDEYFELSGTPTAPLGDLTYVVIGDGAGGSGVIEEAISLLGSAIPADGYFLAAELTYTLTAPATVDLSVQLNFENDDNTTHMLVKDFTGAISDDLDTDDDGTLDVTPWASIVDRVAIISEQNPPGGTEFHYGPPTVGPVGGTSPGHVALCPTLPPEWRIEAFDPAAGDDTPGSPNPAVCGCAGCLADMDGNAILDARDVDQFIAAVLGMGGDGCADVNLDAMINEADIPSFVDRIIASPPCGLGRAFGTRLMTWNLLGYGASVTSDRKDAYKQILNHVEPDIVVAQEVENTASASDFLTSVLNAADGPGGYAMADFVDYVPDSDCALYYKTDKITYNAGVDFAVLPTALRNIMRWKVGHVGAGVEGDLYVYGAHLKAGAGQANVDLRDAEAAIMRADADALPAGTQFVYSGDFNLQNANINDVPFANPPETAWATLTDVGGDPDGQSFDPINAPGLWTGRIVFAGIHTQSPHEDNADAPPGAAAGGMDDRFDFILISDALQDGVDLSVINGSYEAFGNDGNHFNADINDGPVIPQGQAIADALHEASDHLPVIMELGLFMAP